MNREKYAEFPAGSNDDGKRADRIIRQFIREQALSGIYKAFRKGLIRINEIKARPEMKVRKGDTIFIYKSLIRSMPEKSTLQNLPAAGLKKQIIFENENFLVLNKQRGQLVHGGKASLEEQVRSYLANRISPSLSFRPGPLHRLDRNTSGLIFFSKSIEGARIFSSELQNKNFTKYYVALLDGKLEREQQWIDNLQRDSKRGLTFVDQKQGKEAISTAKPIFRYKNRTLAIISIKTGRTHQIRAQAAARQYPLSGDGKYGGSVLKSGYILHCFRLKKRVKGSELINDKIMASVDKEWLKRLNSVLTNCSIEELKSILSTAMEDL